MEQIKQMFELQNELNNSTNGENWTKGKTIDGREIYWYRCIYMEAAEAIDSFNWKHWKNINSDPDWANIRVELVDIWHFIMSEAIRVGNTKYADKYQQTEAIGDMDSKVLVDTLEKMLSLSISATIDKELSPLNSVIDLFFKALSHIGMDTNELYKRYVVKNQLNIFRQNNGYKDGSYIKIWDAVEDNVIAFNIMEERPNLTPQQLYKKLEEEYQQILQQQNK